MVYADAQAVDLPKANPPIPKVKSQMQEDGECVNEAVEDEKKIVTECM